MDKKNVPSLDELLNKVRQSEPVMQEEEAINWLNAQKELPLQKHRFKPSKIIIMTSIISSISIAALIWIFGQGRGDRVPMTDLTIDHRPWTIDSPRTIYDDHLQSLNQEPAMVPEPQSAMVHGPSSMVQIPPLTVDRGLLTSNDTPRVDTVRVIKIVEETNDLDKADGQQQMNIAIEVADEPIQNMECKGQVDALEPGTEELKKLGIVSDGGALMYQQEHTKKGKIKLLFDGLMLTNYSVKMTDLSHLTAPDILPVGIMNCLGQWVFPNGTEKPEAGLLEDALAVKVPVHGASGYLIFWFPRNEAIYKLLGPELSSDVLANGDKYHQLPWKVENRPGNKREADIGKKIYWEPEETIIPIHPYMNELGFKVSEAGINFKRKHTKLEISKDGFLIYQRHPVNEEEQFSESNIKKCIPFYITHDCFYKGNVEHASTLRNKKNDNWNGFKELSFDKYRMVAFRIDHPKEGTYLVWYPYSPAIRAMLNPEERALLDKKLSLIDPGIRYGGERPDYASLDAMFVEERPLTDALNALTPGHSVLNKLGVEVLPDSGIRVSMWSKNALVINDFYKEASSVVGIFGDSAISRDRRDSLSKVFDALVYITDDLGTNFHLYNGSMDIAFNTLIPVLVRSGKSYTLHDKIVGNWRPDIILWFKPSPEILAILESDGSGAIIGDIRSTEIPDTSTVDCRYTELCRNKPGVFHNQLIFPNPATAFSNFSWTSDEPASYSVKLYALNGKQVRAFEDLSAHPGKNQYMMDLSELPPGIYMVILSSDKGDELHERLVIRE